VNAGQGPQGPSEGRENDDAAAGNSLRSEDVEEIQDFMKFPAESARPMKCPD
jgi:hypothetical protein